MEREKKKRLKEFIIDMWEHKSAESCLSLGKTRTPVNYERFRSRIKIIEGSGEGSPLIFFNKLKSPPDRRALLQTLLM